MAMDFALLDRGVIAISKVRKKRRQLHSILFRIVEKSFSSSKIGQERVQPATPSEGAHVESFNSISEKEVIRRFKFSSIDNADNTIDRFIAFYNNERLLSAIGYRAPKEAYEKWKETLIDER